MIIASMTYLLECRVHRENNSTDKLNKVKRWNDSSLAISVVVMIDALPVDAVEVLKVQVTRKRGSIGNISRRPAEFQMTTSWSPTR